MDIRVGKKSQIVIPAALRKAAGIEEGDVLSAEVDDCGVIRLKKVPADPLERLRWAAGRVYAGIDPIALQDESRRDKAHGAA